MVPVHSPALKAELYALRGVMSATAIAALPQYAELNLNKNKIIGIWNRERAKRGEVSPAKVRRSRLERDRNRRAERAKLMARLFAEPAKALPVPFIARGWEQCVWPLWDDSTPPDVRMCCGSPQQAGSSYCGEHFTASRRAQR